VYGYKTLDLCNGADPVCSNGDDVAAHSPYVQSGLAAQAAQFVADPGHHPGADQQAGGPEPGMSSG